jgi:hypothetical protein
MRALMLCLCLPVVACSSPSEDVHARLQARESYWRELLRAEASPGTDRAAIEQWAHRQSIPVTYLPGQNWIYGNVEQVPDSGNWFCSSWNIIVTIQLDARGKAVSNTVYSVGSCM